MRGALNGLAFDAAVFDLDGVITMTARVHAAAWKELFDSFFRSRVPAPGEELRPFTEADYLAYVDGRPRYDGVAALLASRGIALPYGSPFDPPDHLTVCGLGNRKNLLVRERLHTDGVEVDHDAVRFIGELRDRGIRVGVASSSENTALIIGIAGLDHYFDVRVDGVISAELGLRGKPAPDIFLECLRRLDAPDAARAMVAEDAIVGVAAGAAGHFGLVLGVAREGNAQALREAGADWVITSFRQISFDQVERYFEARASARLGRY
jgi:HAD superfamily hydrolase (TIGR01509 family)